MFLAQMKDLRNSSNFRFTLYLMGSLWLLFSLVLILLYQLVRISIWDTFIPNDTNIYKLDSFISQLDRSQDINSLSEKVNKFATQEKLDLKIIKTPWISLHDEEPVYFSAPDYLDTCSSIEPTTVKPSNSAEPQAFSEQQVFAELQVFVEPQVFIEPRTPVNLLTLLDTQTLINPLIFLPFPSLEEPPTLFESFMSQLQPTMSPFIFEIPLNEQHIVQINLKTEAIFEVEKSLNSALFISISFTFILLLSATIYYTRRTVSRLNDINKTCNTIIQGNLEQRVPITSCNDDYDIIATHINQMLDRIQLLLQGVQQVSDDIAHDLRTPLTHFRNQLEIINCDKNLKLDLLAGADRILSLFNSLLAITKLEFGAVEVPTQSINLHELIEDIIELYEPIADEKSISIKKTLTDVHVHANKDLIFQSLSNLIDNAIKYTPQKGEVFIAVKSSQYNKKSKGLVITILDTGDGIPVEEHKSVFRRMYRLEKHRTSKGHGLGLTMAKAILDYHQWQLTLQNNDPGLRINIHIPMA